MPPKKSLKELKAAGSWRAGPRKRQSAKKKPAAKPRRIRRVKVDWERVIAELPGYDPWRGAGDFRFKADRCDTLYEFFRRHLTHAIGEYAGRPFVPERWQLSVMGNLYGWRTSDGFRRYREAYVTVARKNGKSTWAAGLAVYELDQPPEAGSIILSAASTRDQARMVWRQAKAMIERNEYLWERCKPYQHSIIKIDDFLTCYKPVSSEGGATHGENPEMAIVDELHLQPNRELVDAIKTGMGARRQPMMIYLTTAGHDRQSLCYEVYDYAQAVRDGAINNPEFLPVIYEVPIEANWKDKALWPLANPNLGISVQRKFLESEFARAEKLPSYENTFRNLYLNQWVEQAERWISVEAWNECSQPVDESKLLGRQCWGGLDLSLTTDLSAFVLAFPMQGGLVYLKPFFWLPIAENEDIIQRGFTDKVDYQTWVNSGLLHRMPTRRTDFPQIRKTILECAKKYRLRELAYDPYAAGELSRKLSNEDGLVLFEHRQGTVSMGPACKNFEGLVLERKIAHGGNPVLTWNLSNVAVKRDESDNIRLDKKRSAGRIDGIVAAVMAVGRLTANLTPESGKGIIWI